MFLADRKVKLSKFSCEKCDFTASEKGPPFGSGTRQILNDQGNYVEDFRPHTAYEVLGIDMFNASEAEKLMVDSRYIRFQAAVCADCGNKQAVAFDIPPNTCEHCGSHVLRAPHRLMGFECPKCHHGKIAFKGIEEVPAWI